MLSENIKLEKGTRQGCPLSPLLFALAVKPLAALIRQQKEIEGIKMGKREDKIGLYADDIVLYLSNIKMSLKNVLEAFAEFAKISGLKMNPNKSEIYPIYLPGDLRTCLEKTYPFRWT